MAANRTIYLLSLLGAVVFFAAETFDGAPYVWFSWAVLFVLLILPVLSLLLSLPQILSLRVALDAPARTEEGEPCCIHVRLHSVSRLPLPELRLQLVMKLLGSDGQERRYLRRVPRSGGTVSCTTEGPGQLCVQMEKLYVYDYLGLFRLRKRLPASTKTAVLPKPQQPRPKPDFSIFSAVRLTPLPQGSFSENHDYRPYRDGDNVRSIHWKLSQKTDDLIVREPVAPARIRCFVLLDPPVTLPALQSELRQLRWLSEALAEQEIVHTVLWRGETSVQAREIGKKTDVLPMLTDACACPVFPLPAPTLSAPEADWCCRILPSQEVRP